jgi:hypothetical protein
MLKDDQSQDLQFLIRVINFFVVHDLKPLVQEIYLQEVKKLDAVKIRTHDLYN